MRTILYRGLLTARSSGDPICEKFNPKEEEPRHLYKD